MRRAYCRACDDAVDAEGPWPGRCTRCGDPIEAHPVADVTGHRVELLLIGINPGLHTVRTRHHFAHPDNRFWQALERSQLGPDALDPGDRSALLAAGLGLTNAVTRATPSAEAITREDTRRGRRHLRDVERATHPDRVAFVGQRAFTLATGRDAVDPGEVPEGYRGRPAYVVPSPSPRNEHVDLEALVAWFDRVARWIEATDASTPRGLDALG